MLALAAAVTVGAGEPRDERPFRIGFTAGVLWSDNLTLLDTAGEEGWANTAGTQILIQHDSRRIDADIDVNAVFEHYPDSQYEDDIRGGVHGVFAFHVLPQRFSWVVEEDFSQLYIDAAQPDTPANLRNYNVVGTGPEITVPLGRVTYLRASGRYSWTYFERSDLGGSQRSAAVAIERALGRLTRASLEASTRRTWYDEVAVPHDDRDEAYLRIATAGARTSISADMGYTQVRDFAGTEGGPLARLEITKQVSPSSSVWLSAGTDFVSSSEALRLDQAMDGVDLDPNATRLANETFRRLQYTGGWVFERRRVRLRLRGSYEKHAYRVFRNLNRRDIRYGLEASRRLTAGLTLSASAVMSRERFAAGGGRYKELEARLGLQGRLGPRMSWLLDYARRDRDEIGSTIPGFSENLISLQLGWQPVGR